ncbi:MAG: AtpZ/AtpI family protein [Chloroflexi bacterium]|nr:AtpZ/AtpI family protein [Chloroflexota bacterium]
MKKTWIAAARFIGIGWYVGLCIAGGFFGGRWVGQKLNQSEVFFGLFGLAIGVGLAAYGIYASYVLLNKNARDENEHEGR